MINMEKESELFERLKILLVEIKNGYVSNGDLVQEMYDLVNMYSEIIDKYQIEVNL